MGTGNTFGKLFKISTYGESHGSGVGVIVDGCPPRIPLSKEDVQRELDRRRPGQSRLTTPRDEEDEVEILSGIYDGLTLGTPISMMVRNKNQKSQDYNDALTTSYRPSHADATYDAKYGVRAIAGGGRSSARETIGRVAAGAIAKKVLGLYSGVEIVGYVQKVQDIELKVTDYDAITEEMVESNIVRCPDQAVADKMIARIDEIRRTGNSIGGVVEVVAKNVPAGLGSPVFDKLEAELAKACMSLPAAKGFESGSGFSGTLLTGKDHNDEFYVDSDGCTRTKTNRSGGIQGGISNGENIIVRVAFKPTSTIGQEQGTVSRDGIEMKIRGKGRHDPCVLPRAVPMVEAMVALTIMDALMQHHSQCELFDREINFNSERSDVAKSTAVSGLNPLGKKLKGLGIAN
jgi:chorismate synthase